MRVKEKMNYCYMCFGEGYTIILTVLGSVKVEKKPHNIS